MIGSDTKKANSAPENQGAALSDENTMIGWAVGWLLKLSRGTPNVAGHPRLAPGTVNTNTEASGYLNSYHSLKLDPIPFLS